MNQKYIEDVKGLLKREVLNASTMINGCAVLPFLHNENKVILQFDGWCITLDGDEWYWEDTTRG